MRTIDVLRKWCGITDGPTLEKEVIRFETAILESAEALGRETGESGIQVLPGVAKLLKDLGAEADKRGGEEKWAICTSCTYLFRLKTSSPADLQLPTFTLEKLSLLLDYPSPTSLSLPTPSLEESPSLTHTSSVLQDVTPLLSNVSLKSLNFESDPSNFVLTTQPLS